MLLISFIITMSGKSDSMTFQQKLKLSFNSDEDALDPFIRRFMVCSSSNDRFVHYLANLLILLYSNVARTSEVQSNTGDPGMK